MTQQSHTSRCLHPFCSPTKRLLSSLIHGIFLVMQNDRVLQQATSWDHFVRLVTTLPNEDRGYPFEVLVKCYLLLEPTYRSKLRHVWLLSEVPETIRTHLRLPGPDEGIDLIAETNDGAFWAIQAKYRTDRYAGLTHGELSTFTSLAFVVCEGIDFALVCTTTERFTALLRGNPRIGERTAEVWESLTPEFFSRVRDSLSGGTDVLLQPLPKRGHQIRAIEHACTHFVARAQSRGKLISPCGSGKSLTAYWIAEALGAKTILVAVPSLALITQTLGEWMREFVADEKEVDWMCVCSDESAGKVDRDDMVTYTHELGVPCETKIEVIAEHLAKMRATFRVVLTTYQSSPVLTAAARLANLTFDLAVLDEAHKTTGRASSAFAHLLKDENMVIPKRLFMTATERRFVGTSDEVASMDDETIYGGTFECLSFKEAIAADPPILCDYEVLTIGVREEEVKEAIRANAVIATAPAEGREMGALNLATQSAIRRGVRDHSIRHIVSFHSSIRRAEEFRMGSRRFNEMFAESPPIASFHVSGKMSTGRRQAQLREFVSIEPSLVTNARCLTEGVNLPAIDCVVFADPKGSKIDIVQAAGRALRNAPGKKRGYILLPLVVPGDKTIEDLAQTSSFKFVMFVLASLATSDERIIEDFQAIARGDTPKYGLVRFDVGMALPSGLDAHEFVRAIELKAWGKLGSLTPMSYQTAHELTQKLGLRSQKQWRRWRHGRDPSLPPPPLNLPSSPDKIYRHQGWTSWGDFCGTGAVSTKTKKLRPFAEARELARGLGLRSPGQWELYRLGRFPEKGTKPYDIPSRPDNSYSTEWQGWPDWLGYLPQQNIDWLPNDEARAFARKLMLRGIHHWKAYVVGKRSDLPPRPPLVPSGPDIAYKDAGWKGWGDWLGNGNLPSRGRVYRDFMKARDFARSLKLQSVGDWRAYASNKTPNRGVCPADIPLKPEEKYFAKGWQSWSDWLGASIKEPEKRKSRTSGTRFRAFPQAREFAQGLQLTSSLEWLDYCRGKFPEKGTRPFDIPASPPNFYKHSGWLGWGDFLGTGNLAPSERDFLPFEDARQFARSLGLRRQSDWRDWCRANRPPHNIPANPFNVYAARGWAGWLDWLGHTQEDRRETAGSLR